MLVYFNPPQMHGVHKAFLHLQSKKGKKLRALCVSVVIKNGRKAKSYVYFVSEW